MDSIIETFGLKRWAAILDKRWVLSCFLHVARMIRPSWVALGELSARLEMIHRREASYSRKSLRERDTQDVGISERATLFPKWNPYYEVYATVSTATVIYVVIKNCLPIEGVAAKIGELSDLRCFLAGRFVADESIGTKLTTLAAAINVLWRLFYCKSRELVSVNYLMMFLNQDEDFMRAEQRVIEGVERCGRGRLNDIDLIIRHVTHYPIRFKAAAENHYKLRPNRKLEQHERISSIFQIFSSLVLIGFWFTWTLMVSAFIVLIATDFHYESAYSNCSHIPRHRVYAFLMDIVQNFCVWFDSLTVFNMTPIFFYILNADLELYWDALEANLNRLSRAVHLRDHAEKLQPDCYYYEQCGIQLVDDWQIELMVIEVQAQMKDFLEVVKNANKSASQMIMANFLGEVGTYIILAHAVSTKLNSGNFVLVLLLQVICILLISGSFALLLVLQRRIMRSYVTICSIMAHDRSSQKRVFMSLCDYYVQGSFSYTCLQQPLTTSALLTFVGWTFSFSVVLTTLSISLDNRE